MILFGCLCFNLYFLLMATSKHSDLYINTTHRSVKTTHNTFEKQIAPIAENSSELFKDVDLCWQEVVFLVAPFRLSISQLVCSKVLLLRPYNMQKHPKQQASKKDRGTSAPNARALSNERNIRNHSFSPTTQLEFLMHNYSELDLE